MLKNVYLAGGVRTPMGAYLGSLAEVPAAKLGAVAIKAALEHAKVPPGEVDEVYMGNVIGAGLGQNIARQCSRGAGLADSVGATTVNKVCGSGLRAIIIAAQNIQCGDLDVVVAGGVESMSQAPYLLKKARQGYRMGNGELVDAMIHDGLWDVYNQVHMGTCGDQTAADFGFSRTEQDDFAVQSCKRAAAAWERGFFGKFVVPVEIAGKKETVRVERDENLARFDEKKLRALKPVFDPKGTVTAGNASGINDGAAACLVLSEEKVKALGVKPIARILGHANAALAPAQFTVAPVHAIRRLSEKLNLKLSDVDVFEINEAFAVVAMVAIRELKLDPVRVNPNGGAVAFGHPIGMTGARLVIETAYALQETGGRIGVACLCIGGGEASAIAVERVD